MSLTIDQQKDLVELTAFRKGLRSIVYGGATAISVDGVRVNMDIAEARRSLREVEAAIAAYNGSAPARPTVLSVSMSGNYSDDNSSTTTEQ